MNARHFIPLIDFGFLSLGAVMAIMSQLQSIETLPVDIARVGLGASDTLREDVVIVTITDNQLLVDDEAVGLPDLAGRIGDRLAVLRTHRRVATERLVMVMSELASADIEQRIEVEEVPADELAGGDVVR